MVDYFTAEALLIFVQVIFVDLILAADNAIIVAMVASRVPEHMRQRIILLGIAAAVVMRIIFSLITVQIMGIPGIAFFGGLLLLWVCYKLWQDIRDKNEDAHDEAEKHEDDGKLTAVVPAIIQIVLADLSMSIDNVVAIAGVSRGYPLILVFGLMLSVAFMIFAATMIARLLERYPWISYVGLAVILYVAVQMIYEGSHDLKLLFN